MSNSTPGTPRDNTPAAAGGPGNNSPAAARGGDKQASTASGTPDTNTPGGSGASGNNTPAAVGGVGGATPEIEAPAEVDLPGAGARGFRSDGGLVAAGAAGEQVPEIAGYQLDRRLLRHRLAELWRGRSFTGMEVVALVLSADGARDRAVVDRLVRASRDAALVPGEHETPLWAANFNAERPYAITQLVPGQTGAERLIDPLDGILGNDEDALQAVRQQLSQYGVTSPVLPPADTTYGGRPGSQPDFGSTDTTNAGTAGGQRYSGLADTAHSGSAGGQPYAGSADTAHAGHAGGQPYSGSSFGDQPYGGGSGRLKHSDIPSYVDHAQADASQFGGAMGAGRTSEAGGAANFRASTAPSSAVRGSGAVGGGGPAGGGGVDGARGPGGDAVGVGRGATGEVVRRYWGRLGNWVYLVVAVVVLVVFSFAYSIGAAVGSGVKDAPAQAAPPPAVSPEPYPASVLLPPIDRVTTAPYKRPDGKPGVVGATYPVGTDLQVITNAELPFALGWPRPPQVDYLGESSSLILRRIVTRSEDPDDKNGVDNLFKAQLALHPCVSLAQCLADRLSFDQQWTKLFKSQAPVTAKDPKTWVSVSNPPYVVTMTRAFHSGGQWWLIGAMVYGAPSEATDIQHVVNDIWWQTS